jgi:hypothetical protein
MNGDGRKELVGTWDGQGVFYRNNLTGAWTQLATPATQIACGDLDGDGIDDLIGIWPSQSGVWVKYSKTGLWSLVSSSAVDITAGRMRASGSAGAMDSLNLRAPFGSFVTAPVRGRGSLDQSDRGPGGRKFVPRIEANLIPLPQGGTQIQAQPGPGDPGFRCIRQKNLSPKEDIK